jgi:autotransporter-associated beta strand protein
MKTVIAKAAIALLVGLAASAVARADVYINEIYFDPPGSLDGTSEYIELRGTPSASLSNYYLILLENENNADNTGDPGHIDSMFDLGTYSLGSNGFLTMRQKNTPYLGYLAPAAGTTDLVNTGTGFGWGNGATSSVHAAQETGGGVIENSGFTAMLIRNNGTSNYAPYLGQDLDQGNNGLDLAGSDVNSWRSNWTILDSIGIHAEAGEAQYGRLYGNINFGPEATTNIEPGATYVGVGFEIEYIGRWGDSTGQTASDWNVSNLTNDPASGYTSGADYRQSGDPHPIGGVFAPNFHLESSHGVPYGTPLCRTLGATNFGAPAFWTGLADTTWSTASGLNNWKNSSGTAIDYANGIDATFDNTATGLTADISAADVSPSSVVFNNSTKNFTVTGTKGIAGSTGILKQGTGKVTLSSVNSYTGVTTVDGLGGTLQLNGVTKAQAPVLTGGGANIKAGKMVFDYTGEGSPAATIKGLLTTSYHAGAWNTGKFNSTTADSNKGLGWVDNTATSQVTVAQTLYGDANVSGGVDLSDLASLGANWNSTGKVWSQGDFNYDGNVNLSDLAALGAHWNQSISGFSTALDSATVVPEPGSIVLLLVGGVATLIYAWRRRRS